MNLRPLLLAARPKTLPAAIVPVWVGCVLSHRLTGGWDGTLAAFTLTGSIAIQIATNFFNDAIDSRKGADTERRVGPQRVTASGLMAPRTVMACGMAFVALAFFCGVPLYHARGWPIVAIGLPSLFLTYGYTGGPFPLAYRGMGELFVVLFFGLVAVAGTVFIQTGEWLPEAFLLGAQIGLLSAVLISINNLRDREEDSTTGKRTLAVRLGDQGGKEVIAAELGMAALAAAGWLVFGMPGAVLAVAALVPTGVLVLKGVFGKEAGPHLNRCLALGGMQLILFAAAFHAVTVFG